MKEKSIEPEFSFLSKFMLAVVALAIVGTVYDSFTSDFSRRVSKGTLCLGNLRNIALALHTYESIHGQLPPAFTVDENGNRLHSWRVLLLPYLDASNLYEAINLDVPWDHPSNLKFHNLMPDAFRCPQSIAKAHETTYVIATGPDMLWDSSGKPRSIEEVKDGMSETFSVFEMNTHPVNWMSPNNPTFDELKEFVRLRNRVNPANSNSFFSGHPGGGTACRCNGTATFLTDDLTPERVRPAFTHASDDIFDFEF